MVNRTETTAADTPFGVPIGTGGPARWITGRRLASDVEA